MAPSEDGRQITEDRQLTMTKISFPSSVLRLLSSELVGLGGLEPPTSPLSGVRSNHLSYRPVFDQVICVDTLLKIDLYL